MLVRHCYDVGQMSVRGHRQPARFPDLFIQVFVPENGQRNVLFPRTVFPHADPESRAEEKLSCCHQIAFLRRLELQDGTVPDEGVEFTVGEDKDQKRQASVARVLSVRWRRAEPTCL